MMVCRCEFSNADRDVHILLTHNEDDMMAVVPPAAREMFHCFSKVSMKVVPQAQCEQSLE